MSAKTSTHSVLIIVLLIVTFPLWIGLAGGLFGLVAGLAGAVIGIIAGIFGAILGVIGAVVGGVFGIFDWGWNDGFYFPHVISFKALLFVALIVGIIMLSKSRKKKIN